MLIEDFFNAIERTDDEVFFGPKPEWINALEDLFEKILGGIGDPKFAFTRAYHHSQEENLKEKVQLKKKIWHKVCNLDLVAEEQRITYKTKRLKSSITRYLSYLVDKIASSLCGRTSQH